MAKALSQVYTTIRGSVGGVTYTANSYHPIVIRSRTAPVNPKTNTQERWRESFGRAIAEWRGFPTAGRVAWNGYAESLEYSGPTGSYNVPGRQAFVGPRTMLNVAEASGEVVTSIDTAPPAGVGRYLDVFILNLDAGEGELSFDVSNLGLLDVLIYAQISRPMDYSRERFGGPFQPGQFVAVATGSIEGVTFSGLSDARYWMRVSGVTTSEYNIMYPGRTVRKDVVPVAP